MKAEIIAVGTEILLGEIVDTNSVYLSQIFAKLGIDVFRKTTVGDNEDAIINALKSGSQRSDLIITIGGLGPTEDDITKQTLAKFLKRDLILDPVALEGITNYFKQQNKPLTKNNERQALLLKGAHPIQNSNGLALGLFQHTTQADYIVLPGPPTEFRSMVDQQVVPLINERYGLNQTIQSKTLHFVGIGEAALATRVDELIRKQTNPTIALYFKPTDVTIRITVKANSNEEAQQKLVETKTAILEKVGEFYYAEGDNVSFTNFVTKQLIKQKITLTAAESLTGGDFQSAIVETSGASTIFHGGFITYANETKKRLLDVSELTLKKHSVVSREVAEEMATGAQQKMQTDLALSFTGVAGPDTLEGHQPGNVWIGLVKKDGTKIAREYNFVGNREKIRHLAVVNGFKLIWENVLK